jgi:rhomboid protease GluP
VYYGRRTGSRHIGQAGLQYALIAGAAGFFLPGIDNWAHGGGFCGGYLAALLLDPLKRERIDHVLVALVCLVISLGAVAVTFVYTLQFSR